MSNLVLWILKFCDQPTETDLNGQEDFKVWPEGF